MAVILDVAGISHNASIIRGVCDGAALATRAMCKQAYAIPAIVEAMSAGGIDRFGASSVAAARRVARITGRECGLFGIDAAAQGRSAGAITPAMHRNVDAVIQALAASRANFAWLSVLTSDGRDGLAPAALMGAVHALSAYSELRGRFGVLLNWGCLGGAPPRDELQGFADLLTKAAAGAALPVSLGGSALLPLLGCFSIPGSCEVRVGEAILTGTIPGSDGSALGLVRPISLDASVVDLQMTSDGARRIAVDRGKTCLDIEEVTIRDIDARPFAASSELALFDLAPGARAPQLGAKVELLLGYQSTLRTLLNRTIRRQMRYSPGAFSTIARRLPQGTSPRPGTARRFDERAGQNVNSRHPGRFTASDS